MSHFCTGWTRALEEVISVHNPMRETNLQTAKRTVIHGDALEWLAAHPQQQGCSLLASMPDVSELGCPLPVWEEIFRRAVRLCLAATPPGGLCCFFQTDTRHDGGWISKGGIVLSEAAALGVPLLWHKVVLRVPPNTASRSRAGYSHLMAFSAALRIPADRATPDALPDLGAVPWSHSMGTRAAVRVMRDVRSYSPETHTILQPFCGIGTALAVANAHGFHAIGIERNRRRAEQARLLSMDDLRAAAAELRARRAQHRR